MLLKNPNYGKIVIKKINKVDLLTQIKCNKCSHVIDTKKDKDKLPAGIDMFCTNCKTVGTLHYKSFTKTVRHFDEETEQYLTKQVTVKNGGVIE
jgi:hypothetical protein